MATLLKQRAPTQNPHPSHWWLEQEFQAGVYRPPPSKDLRKQELIFRIIFLESCSECMSNLSKLEMPSINTWSNLNQV